VFASVFHLQSSHSQAASPRQFELKEVPGVKQIQARGAGWGEGGERGLAGGGES
jgi:hypothetical protein